VAASASRRAVPPWGLGGNKGQGLRPLCSVGGNPDWVSLRGQSP